MRTGFRVLRKLGITQLLSLIFEIMTKKQVTIPLDRDAPELSDIQMISVESINSDFLEAILGEFSYRKSREL